MTIAQSREAKDILSGLETVSRVLLQGHAKRGDLAYEALEGVISKFAHFIVMNEHIKGRR